MSNQPTNQQTNKQTNKPTNKQTRRPSPRLTIEMALWVLVTAIALTLRLYRLDAAPLTMSEAREALLAWQATTNPPTNQPTNQQTNKPTNQLTNHQTNQPTNQPTNKQTNKQTNRPTTKPTDQPTNQPFLFIANTALFTLFGASDALARLWPALFGSALVLMPALLRQRVGRLGAWVAALYLAISPTALFASRQLDGTVITAMGVMAALGGLLRFFDGGRRSWLVFAASGLALAVVASSVVYGLVLTLVLAWLSLAWAWPDEKTGALWKLLRPHLLHALAVFLLVGLALCTGFFWNPAGLGAAGNLVAGWLARFGAASNLVAGPLVLVTVYEPLALFFGLGGLVWAVRRRWRFGVLLGVWAGLQALLGFLMPGRLPLDMLGIVLPLALLAGYAIAALVQNMQARAWIGEWVYALVVVVLWVHLYLRLARHALDGDTVALLLAFLTVVLQTFLAAVLVMVMQTMAVLRGLVVGTGIVLLVATLSAGWGVSHLRSSDPRELLTYEPTAETARDLVRTLRDLSWRKTGMPETLPFTLVAPGDPVAAWYLRDFSAMRQVEDPRVLGEDDLGEVVVASWPGWSPPGDYVGQKFVVRRGWDAREVRCTWEGLLRWLLFRQAPGVVASEEGWVLWRRR